MSPNTRRSHCRSTSPSRRRETQTQGRSAPVEPLDLRLGSTLLFPYVGTSVGYNDNPNRHAWIYERRPSAFFRDDGGLIVKSDWSRHNLEGDLRGGQSAFFNAPNASRPNASGQFAGR